MHGRLAKNKSNKHTCYANMYNNRRVEKRKYSERLKLLVKTVIDKYNESVTEREQAVYYDPDECTKQTSTLEDYVHSHVTKQSQNIDTREKIFLNIFKHDQPNRSKSALENIEIKSKSYESRGRKCKNVQKEKLDEGNDTQIPFSEAVNSQYTMLEEEDTGVDERTDIVIGIDGQVEGCNDSNRCDNTPNSCQMKSGTKMLERRKKIVVTLPDMSDNVDGINNGDIQIYTDQDLTDNGNDLKDDDEVSQVGKLQYRHRSANKRVCKLPHLDHSSQTSTPYFLAEDSMQRDVKTSEVNGVPVTQNTKVITTRPVTRTNTATISAMPRVISTASIPIVVRSERKLLSVTGSNLQNSRNLQSSQSLRSSVTPRSDQETNSIGNRLSLLILHRKRAKAQSSKYDRSVRAGPLPYSNRHESVYSRFDGMKTSLPQLSKTKDIIHQRKQDISSSQENIKGTDKSTADNAEIRHCRFEVSKATDISEFVYQVLMEQNGPHRNWRSQSRRLRSATQATDARKLFRRPVLSGNLTDRYRTKLLRPKAWVKTTPTARECYKT